MTYVYGTRSSVLPVSRRRRVAASTLRRQHGASGSITRNLTN
ncbi:hypothetical protein ABZ619_40005 [Streptomyces sp. NPDC007851]